MTMKFTKFIYLLGILAFIACNNTPDRPESVLTEEQKNRTTTTTNNSVTPPTTPEPAQNAAGVWHYTCPNGCDGGAGSAQPCAKCGATLAHNSEYHNSGNATPTTPATPTTTTTNVASFSDGQLTTTPNSNVNITGSGAEPAQNAAGVWHYTCPNGCAGGGGSAGPCGSCGATLAHNSAYHQ